MTAEMRPAKVIPLGTRSEITGAALVRTMIIALALLLIADRFGLAISLFHFVIAAGLAVVLHFLGYKAYQLMLRFVRSR